MMVRISVQDKGPFEYHGVTYDVLLTQEIHESKIDLLVHGRRKVSRILVGKEPNNRNAEHLQLLHQLLECKRHKCRCVQH